MTEVLAHEATTSEQPGPVSVRVQRPMIVKVRDWLSVIALVLGIILMTLALAATILTAAALGDMANRLSEIGNSTSPTDTVTPGPQPGDPTFGCPPNCD